MYQYRILILSLFVCSLFFIADNKKSVASELESGNTLVAQNESDSSTDNLSNETEGGDSNGATEQEITLDELRIPDAPALSILGSPKIEISNPGTPRAFGLSLIESFSDSDSAIPQNFAIDIAPYWWSKKTFNTLDDYICRTNDKEVPEALTCDKIGFGESLIRSLTFSIASSEADFTRDEEEIDLTRVGLGLRFSLISGDMNPAFINKMNSISPENLCLWKIEDGEKKPLSTAEFEQCGNDKTEALRNLAIELQELNATRVGWQLDFALASAVDFEDDNFDNAEFTRFGTWLTASYQPTDSEGQASSVTFLGLGRYLYDDFEDEGDTFFDLGGRLIWKPADTPLSASVEYLRRLGDNDDDRLVGLVEYKFSDTYSVFASFGKGFEEAFTDRDDVVTFLGINIGLGQKPKAEMSTP